MGPPLIEYVVDPKLKDWATPRQAELIDAINEHGGLRAASRALGRAVSGFSQMLSSVKAKASLGGYSPDHDLNKPIAPGYVGKGHSTLYRVDKQTGEKREVLQWVKTKADEHARANMIEQAFLAASDELPRLPPLDPPDLVLGQLLNLYTITDYHLGMQAWAAEGGEDWDLVIAEMMLHKAFAQMVSSSPAAHKGVVNIQGDFLHTDGKTPVTPLHRHVLDASGRYAQMVHAAVRVMRRVVDMALARHTEVEVIFAEGNHDLEGSMWLRIMFAALYENEPRLTVNASELPFYVVRWGKVMLGIHHGHQVKNDALPLLFAAQYPTVWGETTKRYAHAGHRHHAETKEHSGMIVEQHPTLSARDAYAARGGWIAERAARCITYHETFGEVGRTTVTPEMLVAA
jgi:hypothetical protein